MTVRKYSFAVTSDGAQVATVYSPRLSGYLKSIQYVKTDYADTVDFTITAEATGQTLWTEANVTASVIKHPRAATHGVDGAAALYADAGAAVNDLIAIGSDRVKVVLAQAGATKTGTFVVTIVDPGTRYA
jgi:hypothetical protein